MNNDLLGKSGARARLAIALAAVAALLITVLSPVATTSAASSANSPAPRGDGVDRPWSGYHIRYTGLASGGWFGGRRFDSGIIAYRIDPGATPAASTYRRSHRVLRVVRHGKPLPRRTLARAAWILSRYGAVRFEAEDAAVDAAVYHLLAGGPWRINKLLGARRISQAQFPADVHRYAKKLLRFSAFQAGPYRTKLTATPTAASGTVRLTMTVRSAAGRPLHGLPVIFKYPGSTGAAVNTDDNGTAAIAFPAGSGGTVLYSADVQQLPQWHLFLRAPRHHGASRLAVAGKHYRKDVHGSINVTGAQVLGITNTASTYLTTDVAGGTWSLTGHGGARNDVVALFGPFPNSAKAGCTGDRAIDSHGQVDADGTFPLPGQARPKVGFYVWGVAVAGNATNQPAVACGSPFNVRVAPTLSISANRTPIQRKDAAYGRVTVGGLQDHAARRVVASLYGPFPQPKYARCTADKLFAKFALSVKSNGEKLTGAARPDSLKSGRAAYYVWYATMAGSDFSTPVSTKCGGAGSYLRVNKLEPHPAA